MPEAIPKNHSPSNEAGLWFQNRGLFSDHFLKARLPQWKEWETDEELATFRKELMSLYESKETILPYLNEAQTEEEFVQPVLDLLGYANSYIVQAPTKVGQQTNRPDYALFPDETTKNKAYQKLKGNDYTQCIGVADAKYWERELDLAKSSERDTFTNQNPSFQIVGYLTGTQQKWGILTNGRLWRLYCIKSHLPLGNYYQVDLVKLLEEAPEEQLKYFYLFFRKAALLQVDGKSFLDHVLEGSNEYAVELEADIKERVYEVVELLCRGFAAGFSKKQFAELALKDIYDNSLTLLYRLLFVFYAEARELLPLTTRVSYRDNYSMRKITHDIDEVIRKGQQLTSQSTIYYQRVGSLFGLINTGDPGLGVPEYNGGLFDPEEHPFLEGHAIADAHLVPAIQQLAQVYDKELKRVVAVDYNTLSERHLGSIYEGLLEFKPRTAPYDLVTIKEKGNIKYAPASKYSGKEIAYKKNELYLANDKGERKASGSYYTPEYIVNYIVENTLDPLVKEAQDKIKALKPEVDKATAKWQKLKEQKQGLEPTDKYDHKIAEERERLLEPYLSLKVLDPAMGSGHFLARATDFLAEAIATDPSIESPTELTEESELTYYRRRVVESCIYGVDLNPLAVELAKLTLWLGTMAKSKPLSFLNHHLRVGNSLIGAKVANLDEIPKKKGKRGKPFDTSRAPVQLGIFQEAFNRKLYDLLQNRALIAQLPTETLEDVRNKEKWERDFEHDAERFRTLADIWVSTCFGNNVRWDEYNALVENLQSIQPEWERLLKKEYVKEALAMREERRFFHWELQFPEVFYDEQGNRKTDAGFDAVVGNPPYGAEFDQAEKSFLNVQLEATTRDSAAYFLETSDKLSSQFYGMIVPKSISFYKEWESIRSYVLVKNFVRYLMDAGLAFPDVNYEQIVIINSKDGSQTGKACIHLAIPLKRPKPQKEMLPDGEVSYDLMKIAKVLIFRGISHTEEKVIRKINGISEQISSKLKAPSWDIQRDIEEVKDELEKLVGKVEDLPNVATQLKAQLFIPAAETVPETLLTYDFSGRGPYSFSLKEDDFKAIWRNSGYNIREFKIYKESSGILSGDVNVEISDYGNLKLYCPVEEDSLFEKLLPSLPGGKEQFDELKLDVGKYLTKCRRIYAEIHREAMEGTWQSPYEGAASLHHGLQNWPPPLTPSFADLVYRLSIVYHQTSGDKGLPDKSLYQIRPLTGYVPPFLGLYLGEINFGNSPDRPFLLPHFIKWVDMLGDLKDRHRNMIMKWSASPAIRELLELSNYCLNSVEALKLDDIIRGK